MTEEEKKVAHLQSIVSVIAEGYGGVTEGGTIVDRRLVPDAMVMLENSLLRIPKPKDVPVPKVVEDYRWKRQNELIDSIAARERMRYPHIWERGYNVRYRAAYRRLYEHRYKSGKRHD